MPTMLFTALRKYAAFTGRARRKEYWQFLLLVFILTVVASVIDHVIGMPAVAGLPSDLGGPVENFVSVATLLPSLAVGWRRLHDIGKSGWFSVLWLPPLLAAAIDAVARGLSVWEILLHGTLLINGLYFVGTLVAALYVVYLLVQPGTTGPNRHGPDPKAPGLGDLDRVFA